MFARRNEIDMLNGPIFTKVLAFSVPILLSGMLQLLYNAADLIVVGSFAGNKALAAVGATTPLLTLMTNFFISMAVGSNVGVARALGAGEKDKISKAVHTGILFGILAGLLVGIVSITCARVFLGAMGTPADIFESSVLYLRIYSIGIPFMLFYNFCAAVLRAKGDTQRPLFILTISGAVNVVLNLGFVLIFKMDVDGVALATAISQIIAAVWIGRNLVRESSECRLIFKKLRFHGEELLFMIKIGLPAGVQAVLFNFSNVLYQSAVNDFGSIVIAGNTAAMNLTNFVFQANIAVPQATVTFTGQNVGARQYSRIWKIVKSSMVAAFSVTAVLCAIAFVLREPLLSLYTKDAESIAIGSLRLMIMLPGYCLNSLGESFVGAIRGLGKSLTSMLITVVGVCGLRLLTLFVVFPPIGTIEVLYWSYPVTWFVTAAAQGVLFAIVYRRRPADGQALPARNERR